jgi:hypothetical protein
MRCSITGGPVGRNDWILDRSRRPRTRSLGRSTGWPPPRSWGYHEASQAANPWHPAVLKQADLIEARRKGQQICYSLNTTVVEDFLPIIWDLFSNRRPEESKP